VSSPYDLLLCLLTWCTVAICTKTM